MRLLVKNKFMSLSGASLVTNEAGETVYKVKGSVFSNIFGIHKKTIKDMSKKKLFVIKNTIFHKIWHRNCNIYDAKGTKIAKVCTKGAFEAGFVVEGTTEEMKIQRVGLGEFDILLGDKSIGRIIPPYKSDKKQLLTLTDTYYIDIYDEEDMPFLVAMMIAIDNIHDQFKASDRRH